MSQPFGFRPVCGPSGEVRGQKYALNSTSARVFAGDLMIFNSAGNVQRATSSATSAGPFLGIALEDSKVTLAAGDQILVSNDPDQVYSVCATAAISQTSINLNYKASIISGSTTLRKSQCRLGAVSSSVDGVKAIGVVNRPDNSVNTAGQEILVIINNHYLKGGTGTAAV